MRNNNWWDGDNMWNTFDPYAELQRLKMVTSVQEKNINKLISHNNQLQDLLR